MYHVSWKTIRVLNFSYTVQVVILAGIKFGDLAPNIHEYWRNLNLAVEALIAKLPNLIHRQYFHLYGIVFDDYEKD